MSDDLVSDDLVKRAREVLNGVTDGPWEAALERGCHGVIAQSLPQSGANFVAMVGNDTATPEKEPSRFANATFIAAARELVPAMVDRIEELEAKLAKAKHTLRCVDRRMNDLGGYDGRFSLRKLVSITLAELTGEK